LRSGQNKIADFTGAETIFEGKWLMKLFTPVKSTIFIPAFFNFGIEYFKQYIFILYRNN